MPRPARDNALPNDVSVRSGSGPKRTELAGARVRARWRLRLARVLVVGEVVAPLGLALGEREVGHEVVGRGAVPVPLAGWGDDHVAGTDADERPAAGLDESFALG